MFMNKKTKGYGWYTKVTAKDNPNVKAYIDFSFQRGTEPLNLNENGSYQYEMYIVDRDGSQRKVFPIVEEYNGRTYLTFKVMGDDRRPIVDPEPEPVRKYSINRSASGAQLNGITEDDLPFM